MREISTAELIKIKTVINDATFAECEVALDACDGDMDAALVYIKKQRELAELGITELKQRITTLEKRLYDVETFISRGQLPS